METMERPVLVRDERNPARVTFQIRLPDWLDREVKAAAANAGLTRNAWLIVMARAAIAAEKRNP